MKFSFLTRKNLIHILIAVGIIYDVAGLSFLCYRENKSINLGNIQKPYAHIVGVSSFKPENFDMTIVKLPHLDIKLKKTIKNAFYKDDGTVDSISEHQIELYKKFGYEVDDLNEVRSESKKVVGQCFHIDVKDDDGKDNVICFTYMLNYTDEKWKIFIASHEEMHVVQRVGIGEAYDDLKRRFEKFGFFIKWDSLDIEQQADIVGILRLWETFGNGKAFYSRYQPESTMQLLNSFSVGKGWYVNELEVSSFFLYPLFNIERGYSKFVTIF